MSDTNTIIKRRKKSGNISLWEVKKILPKEIFEMRLSPGEYRFIAAYVSNGYKEVEAYNRAGYKAGKKKSPQAQAKAILNRQTVQEALKQYVETAITPFKDKLEYMLVETLYKRAFYSIQDFYDEDGKPLTLEEIPKELHQVIDGIEEKAIGSGSNQKFVMKYQLADRADAIKALMEFLARYDIAGNSNNSNFSLERRKEVEDIFNTVEKGVDQSVFEKYKLGNDKIIKNVFDKQSS